MESPHGLSSTQERIWFLEQFYGGSALHNVPTRHRLRGDLDFGLLERSLRAIIRRHPILRTRFELVDGVPVQRAHAPVESDLDLRVLDFDEDTVRFEASRPFDLSRAPLLRAVLFRRSSSDHDLLIVLHEIACDSESVCTLLRELGTCYSALLRGEGDVLLESGLDYAAYAEWQRDALQAEKAALDYWKRTLRDAPVLQMHGDRARPESRSFRGGQVPFVLPPEASATLNRFVTKNGMSLQGVLMAFFQVLLHRHSGQDEVCTGFPVSLRRPGTEALIGPLVNSLVLRSDLSANPSLRDFAMQVGQALRNAREHGIPFDAIIEAVKPPRGQAHTPLFQAMLAVKPPEWNRLALARLNATPLAVHAGASRFDLTLSAWRAGETVEGSLDYSSDLFDEPSVRRMLGHFETLIASASDGTRAVGSLPMLASAERATVLFDWNRTIRPFPPTCVHEWIGEQCRRTPDRVAVVCGQNRLTYAELDSRSTALASRLRTAGAGPGGLVGVCVERSAGMVVAVLGVLKSGAAYVPLDPAYPAERLEYMLQNSGAGAVVTERALLERLEATGAHLICIDDVDTEQERRPSGPLPRAGELAYVIYTSGSTGQPKGVAVRHAGLTNFIEAMRVEPGFSESDVLLAVTTLCFDIAGLELYLPLVTGGRVVIATRDEVRDGAKLRRIVETAGITVLQATPATWPLLIEAGWKGDGRLKVLCGGEAMPNALAEQLLSRAGSVWNMYGPTETTVWSSVYRVRGGERSIPVGKPIANTQFYVVDRWNQPVPVGVPGELLIGGTGLAAGYLNDPEKTASRFIENPIAGTPGDRLYRTGDLARYRADGNVEHLGRMDNQVKLRGFRIELGEIEAVLASHPEVRNAAVTVQEDERGEKALVAFVTRLHGCDTNEPELRALLKQKLPEHMIPAAIAFLDAMPQTPNGKIDRKALPRVQRAVQQTVSEGSCDIVELRLTRIWSEVLGVRPASVEQSFFELGGHSLVAARVLARIEQEFGKRLPLAALFAAPTIAQLAAMVRTEGTVRWPRVVTVQPQGKGLPFLFVGGGFNFLSPLAQRLHAMGLNQPFLSLAHPRLEDLAGRRVEDLAAYHLETVLHIQPKGPYYLSGFCAEGVVAFEVAQQLLARGEEIAWLGLFEAENRADRRMARDLVTVTATFSPTKGRLRVLHREGLVRYFRKRGVKAWRLLLNAMSPRMDPMGGPDFLFDFTKLKLYRPKPYMGRKAYLFRRCLDGMYYPDPMLGWGEVVPDVTAYEVPGSHLGMFQEPVVEVLARHVLDGIRGSLPAETCAAAGQV